MADGALQIDVYFSFCRWVKSEAKKEDAEDAIAKYDGKDINIPVFISRMPRAGDIETPPSIRNVSFSHCNSKTHWCVHHVMGMCCIVFDIDRMLFEFVMNF